MISSKATGKFYIGSSNDVSKRICTHVRNLKLNKHINPMLQNIYNKHGKDDFQYIILDYCNKTQKLKLEQTYINCLNPYINIAKSTSAPMEGRKHSSETIKKLKSWKRPKGMDHHLTGKKLTSEHRKKLSNKRKLRKWSEKTKQKMSKTAKRLNNYNRLKSHIESTKKPIIDSNNNIFKSLSDASRHWGISVQAICDNLKGRSMVTKKGVWFEYYGDQNES